MSINLFSVENKVIVITGGLGMLGKEFARALATRGAKVAIFDVYLDEQKIQELLEDCDEKNVMFLSVDITNKSSIESALAEVNNTYGIPHGLINNAALDSPPDAPETENGPFETYPEQSMDRIWEVNTKGTLLCCQVIGGAMANAKRGSIINIGSTYGIVSPDQRLYEYRRQMGQAFYKPVSYSVTKSALLNLTRYLATYWAQKGVRINLLTFGGVYNNQDENFLNAYNARTPLGRMARKNEYNGAIIFLLSDASSYMTGSNLIIDGGWTAW